MKIGYTTPRERQSSMEYVALGKTGIEVSRLGFGGAPVGLKNYLEVSNPTDDDMRQQLLAAVIRAVELGVDYFDTAPAYGQGVGEQIYGEALDQVEKPVFIATKVLPHETNLRGSIEGSLKRLRRDSLDLLQVHGNSFDGQTADAILAPGGLAEQMQQLKAEGLIRLIGFTSEDNNAAVYRFIEAGVFDTVQINFNLLFQHPVDWTHPFGSLVDARERGLGTITMRAMTAGVFQKWMELVDPKNSFNYAPALLQYALSNPLADVVLVGMRSPQMVEENVKICEDKAGRIDLAALHTKFF